MLQETLKQEIDNLSDSQLQKIADFLNLVKAQSPQTLATEPFWQQATSVERTEDFRRWVAQLPETGLSLPNEAFDRGDIYE